MDAENPPMLSRNKLGEYYGFGGPKRVTVPPAMESWEKEWPDYDPPVFTIGNILQDCKPSWADPIVAEFKWNDVDGGIDRRSYSGTYKINDKGYPLNPVGRTGIQGRGSLGKWGPNHAADSILTRWKFVADGQGQGQFRVYKGGAPVLQFLAVVRRDTGELAIPGGMIDLGETAAESAQRECLEEVFGWEEATPEFQKFLKNQLSGIFSQINQSNLIYQGYMDDRRATDNAWIETSAFNYHLNVAEADKIEKIPHNAGSDAESTRWVDIESSMKLYAGHKDLIERVVKVHNCYYGDS